MASRMRCIMNHADFWVMPRARCNFIGADAVLAADDQPQSGKPLSRPIGESSKTVPTLSENFCLGCSPSSGRARRIFKVGHLLGIAWGQRTLPSAQRTEIMNWRQFS